MKLQFSQDISRREFVRRSALGTAGVAVGLAVSKESSLLAAQKKIPVGLQLYSIREQCQKDLAGMLSTVSKIGYKGVEFAGYYGHDAKAIRKMLDDNGLVCCGTHTPYESVQPNKLKETVEFNRTIGNRFLIIPWMEGKTKQDWVAKAKEFNVLADKVKGEGMYVGYHAHAHDFTMFEGVTAWDLFFGGTNAEVVMQLDTSNCREGGADPVAVLRKYPGRARTIHLKASGGGPDSVIGEDKVNWSEVFAFCEGPGKTEWYILEHESGKDPVDAVTRSFASLKKLGKV
jgi:sugar phosphate isomerase/epimerase